MNTCTQVKVEDAKKYELSTTDSVGAEQLIQVCVHVCLSVCIYVCIYMYIYMYVCMCVCMF